MSLNQPLKTQPLLVYTCAIQNLDNGRGQCAERVLNTHLALNLRKYIAFDLQEAGPFSYIWWWRIFLPAIDERSRNLSGLPILEPAQQGE